MDLLKTIGAMGSDIPNFLKKMWQDSHCHRFFRCCCCCCWWWWWWWWWRRRRRRRQRRRWRWWLFHTFVCGQLFYHKKESVGGQRIWQGKNANWNNQSSEFTTEATYSLKLTASLRLEKWWLRDDPFLLGYGLFSGAMMVYMVMIGIHEPSLPPFRVRLFRWL